MDDLDDDAAAPTDAIAQAAMAEAELRRLGVDGVHVHPHGDHAILRLAGLVDLDETVAWTPLLRGEILRAVRSAGFRQVSVDLDPGFAD